MRHTQKRIGLAVIAAILAACGQVSAPSISANERTVSAAPMPTASYAEVVYEAKRVAQPQVMLTRPVMLNMQPENTEKYGQIDPNPVHAVAQSPISTFSVDVDTGSYANVRRFLNKDNRLPPTNAVRIEELINYFDYDDAQPRDDKPFAVHTEVADSPWKTDAKLIRIGIKAQDITAKQLPPANLVFLVDVSGSMNSEDKLPLVKQTLHLLTERLRPQDKVTLITYASGEKLLLSATSDKEKIIAAVDSLQANGATHGEQAIQMAYREAQKHFIPNGINRILLATDGDFNVGITDFNALKDLAAEKRKSGVSLTTLGYGTGNYNEHLMEQLADAGDGNYSYIDNIKEAQKVLQRQLSSTLATVAQDVKIQVEFNPATVQEYRLVGYENRMLKQEDFNNDKVDAGDIGAGHSVTAIYEIVPTGKQGWLDKSRYQAAPKVSGSLKEYGFVKLRYKKPNTPNSLLIEQPIAVGSKPLARASNNMQWAVAVASYGQQLQGGKYNGNMTWADMLKLAQNNAKPDPYGLREEFISLLQKAQSLSSQAK
ncbi:vWA domain-containing protein [Wielerella bovis]|uniref:vWA domain-containing protein n=1 Tax=Wielerella bovis TaxID=2917790 RepID=UPI003D2B741B